MSNSPLATVVILTYNGETYLERILSAVESQEIDGEVETLVIDSGSTDGTLDIVRRFPNVRLHQIPNEEFGHGKTRNLAAQLAHGEYVAYLTHDAVPSTDQWLKQLLMPFALHERVVAVTGRQHPRTTSFPLQKFEITAMFGGLGPEAGTTLFFEDQTIPRKIYYITTFYSDVNSAARRDFLLNVIPYRDVLYAEDQMFGQDIVEAGYYKAYSSRAVVEHSNDLTFAEFGRRIFDETVGLRRIGAAIPPMSRWMMFRFILSGVIADSMRIARDKEYSRGEKARWLFVNPFYHLRKWTVYRRSTLVDLTDHEAIKANSLEHSRKRN